MKLKLTLKFATAWLALSTLDSALSTTFAQSTAFTYQGRFNTNNAPYTGSAEFRFTLWNAADGGNAVATNNPVTLITPVMDGLFTVSLEFGLDPFNGQERFLEIGARTDTGAFTTLSPRQPVTPTPYALRALSLTTNGLATGIYGSALTFDNSANLFTGTFTGAVSGNGAGITNVNAATLDGLSGAAFWQTGGNAGIDPNTDFLGTLDDQPFMLRVNNQRALKVNQSRRVDPGQPFDFTYESFNWLAGHPDNSILSNVVGGTIGGGGLATSISGIPMFARNLVTDDLGVVGGGSGNTAGDGDSSPSNGKGAAILGGSFNQARASLSTIGGGQQNVIAAAATYSVISGGLRNQILDGTSAAILGGTDNTNSGTYATVAGGVRNHASGTLSFAAGHRAKAMHVGSWVWGDSDEADFSSTDRDQFLIRAAGGVGIGITQPGAALDVAGTVRATAFEGPDGMFNINSPTNSPLAFKVNGVRMLSLEAVGAGEDVNVIVGSPSNDIADGAIGATIGGGSFETIDSGSDHSVIGGGSGNRIRSDSPYATISGGRNHTIFPGAEYAFIGGGFKNEIGTNSESAVIAGGFANSIAELSSRSFLGGGWQCRIGRRSGTAVVVGGRFSLIGENCSDSTLVGGLVNSINDDSRQSFIGGGWQNEISASYATIPGGEKNMVTADHGFAAGRRANANHTGAFVWADSTDADFASTANNQFLIRASGGVGIGNTSPKAAVPNAGLRVGAGHVIVDNNFGFFSVNAAANGIGAGMDTTPTDALQLFAAGAAKMVVNPDGNVGIGTSSPSQKLHVVGNILATGTITPNSDRNVKKNFAPVDSLAVLERVAALPIQRWTYQAEDDTVRHVGPMAQDFHAAFGVGANDTTIATVDADGVALAAIQGLNQKMETEVTTLRAENAELKQRLGALEKLINRLAVAQIPTDKQ